MQIAPKLKNKSIAHSLLLKPRIGDVVSSGGFDYVNISGINSAIDNVSNWFKISTGTNNILLDKTAGNITGTDPDFKLDLSGDGLPLFPNNISVYVDIDGDGNYLMVSPVIYNPVTKILSGMSSDADFPDQRIKILVL